MPKPLLEVAGRPFLEYLLFEARRFGFERVLLLAGHFGQSVRAYVDQSGVAQSLGLSIDVMIEEEPAGTGGALWRAKDRLDERFFLLNGDSWFDFNWLSLVTTDGASEAVATMALRRLDDPGRFGVVETDGTRVIRFRERAPRLGPADINAGVYMLSRRVLDHVSPTCSLEREVFPTLAEAGLLRAAPAANGRFIDIGVPGDFAAAQSLLPLWRRRPAAFLDRDGTLNEDAGYVHRIEDLRWLPGAVAAVRRLNDLGRYVFVVTNQSGVARGLYDEAAVQAFHARMQEDLRAQGAHVDDFRYCPFHPDGVEGEYRREHAWRKPAPGMLHDLMEHWPVDIAASVMIGDKAIDASAGEAAGMRGVQIAPGNLAAAVAALSELA